MSHINLLSWREEARERLKKEFLAKLGLSAVVGLFLAFLWVTLANAQLESQQERNQYLQTHISELDKKVAEINELKERKQAMIARMRVIQDLQGTRSEIVKLFDEFVRAVPDGVYLSGFSMKVGVAEMKGFSESNNRISAFMRNLDKSYKYVDPNLTKVAQDNTLGDQGSVFDLQVKVETPSLEQVTDGNGQ